MALYSSGFGLYAQTNNIITDFLEEGTAWVEVKLAYDFDDLLRKEGTALAKLYYYYIDRDSIISGEHFGIVNAKMMYNQNLCSSYEFPNLGAIRINTEKKILYRSLKQNIEYSLYDFGTSLEIGNIISYGRNGWTWELYSDTVVSIDTIDFKNGYNGLLINQKFIYGLGHIDYPLWWAFKTDYENDTFDSPSKLLCFFYKGEIILQDDELMEQIKKSIGIDANHILPPTSKDCKDSDAPIYDLTGRRLNSIPEKGIYIQEGKKRVVK